MTADVTTAVRPIDSVLDVDDGASNARPTHGPSLARRWVRPLRWALLVGALAAGTVAGVRYRRAHVASPLTYETAKVDRGPIAAKVTATGAVSPLVSVLVGSQVSGRIDKLFVDFGSSVRSGQTIATIEASFFRAAVTQARANSTAAKSVVERARAQEEQADRALVRTTALMTEGLASRADYDAAFAAKEVAIADHRSALATVTQATAALEQAELNLRYTTILSPIDGIVISRNVDVGQTVAAALQAPTLFTIAQDLTRMQVDTNVAEADVGKIRAGMPVKFTVDAYPQRNFDGVVRQVRDNALTVQNVVTYDAVIDVDNRERLLKPGMTASVMFTYATRESALRVPNGALRFKPEASVLAAMNQVAHPRPGGASLLAADQRALWVLRDGQLAMVSPRIGISDGTSSEVADDSLREGDSVVVEASLLPGGAK